MKLTRASDRRLSFKQEKKTRYAYTDIGFSVTVICSASLTDTVTWNIRIWDVHSTKTGRNRFILNILNFKKSRIRDF
jgi:hypothetical protein